MSSVLDFLLLRAAFERYPPLYHTMYEREQSAYHRSCGDIAEVVRSEKHSCEHDDCSECEADRAEHKRLSFQLGEEPRQRLQRIHHRYAQDAVSAGKGAEFSLVYAEALGKSGCSRERLIPRYEADSLEAEHDCAVARAVEDVLYHLHGKKCGEHDYCQSDYPFCKEAVICPARQSVPEEEQGIGDSEAD